MMPADLFHTAYHAARRGDEDGAYATLNALEKLGPSVLEEAMRRWIDRTLRIMYDTGSIGENPPGFETFDMRAAGAAEADGIDQVATEVSWSGRMFMAHCTGDFHTWNALVRTVPADALASYAYHLLTTMTHTADTYAAKLPRRGPYDAVHRADMQAVAHLN
jgi:hypothetical protein